MSRQAHQLIVLLVLGVSASSCQEPEKRKRSRDGDDDSSSERSPAVSASAAASAARVYPPLEFGTDEPAARAKALEERRPLIVVFGAAWSMACKELQTRTFADPEVKKKGGRFVGLRVDVTHDEDAAVRALMVEYKVTGVPAVILFDEKGVERKRITQFVDARELSATLEAINQP